MMPLPKTCTNAGFSLRLVYQKYLLDYERVFVHHLPDIPPPPAPRGGMPVPEYPPENVAMADPFAGLSSREERKRTRSENDLAGIEEEPAAPSSSVANSSMAGAHAATNAGSSAQAPVVVGAGNNATTTGASEDTDLRPRELSDAVKRVCISLACVPQAREVDWALSVLLVQTQKNLPIFEADKDGRLGRDIASLLLDACKSPPHDERLMGYLFNPLSQPGSQRVARIATVLFNAVALEANRKPMSSCRPFVEALVKFLASPVSEQDVASKLNLMLVLEQLVVSGCKLQNEEFADALLRVATDGLSHKKDVRYPISLTILSNLTRDRENVALWRNMITQKLMSQVVLVLGESLRKQAAQPGGEAGLFELEASITFLSSCSSDKSLLQLFFKTHVVRLLFMFLSEATNPASPRPYLALYRRALTILTRMLDTEVGAKHVLSHLDDALFIHLSKCSVSEEVKTLMDAIARVLKTSETK